jgi:hypothetical protein
MKTPRSVAPAAFIAVLVLACVRTACAQPVSSSTSSVQWAAANSQLIVRAVIEDVSVHKFKNGLHLDTGINRFQTVSVRVLETLKGDATDRLQFVNNRDIGHFKFRKAKESKQQVLLFLDHWSRNRHFNRAYGAYAYTRFPLVVQYLAVLKPDSSHWAHTDVPVLSSDLTRLSKPKQLISTIKSYLDSREDKGPVPGKTITLPAELRSGFYEVHFTFPVDASLEGQGPRKGAAEAPVLDFEEFKSRYAKQKPPPEELRTYGRTGSGYVGVDALELMATDCDAIVRGVIEDSCFFDTDSKPTIIMFGVRMRVLETLKGKCPEQIGVRMRYPRNLEKLQRDRQELVVFLRSRRLFKPAAALGYQTRDGLWEDSAIVLNEQNAQVLFADLTWHRQPNEILDRLRVVARRERRKQEKSDDRSAPFAHHGTRPPVFWFHPPASLMAGSVLAGNVYSRVYLPVDKELEANARKWATSKNQDQRWLAARAMIYFKSDENAAVLKKMLDDDATWGRKDMLHMMENLPYPHEPRYLVRWEAWHVLAGWGYDVPNPSFGESRRTNR